MIKINSFFVYMPSLVEGDSDPAHKKLLYYYPETVAIDGRENALSLVEGLTAFSRSLSDPVELYRGAFELSESTFVVIEANPGVFFCMETRATSIDTERHLERLQHIVSIVSLLLGPLDALVKLKSVPGVRCVLYKVLADTLGRPPPTGINYLPISTSVYLQAVDALHQMRTDVATVREAVLSVGPDLLYSDLALEDTEALMAVIARLSNPSPARPAECVALAHVDVDHEGSRPTRSCPGCGQPVAGDLTDVTLMRRTTPPNAYFLCGPVYRTEPGVGAAMIDMFEDEENRKKARGDKRGREVKREKKYQCPLSFPRVWVLRDGVRVPRRLVIFVFCHAQFSLLIEDRETEHANLLFLTLFPEWLQPNRARSLGFLAKLHTDGVPTAPFPFVYSNMANKGVRTSHGGSADDSIASGVLARFQDDSLHCQYAQLASGEWVVGAQANGRQCVLRPELDTDSLVEAHASLLKLDRTLFRTGDAGLFEVM
ncbi:Protein of unknown function DUF1712 [Carpediemonas membranifera]|uniref:CCZ1/INTU/HSP4 first Longin domain-containing protein n=1 Tax=Carpediemonas membranifera TaxID=201153 RepID=A0A8J6B072_9EUKA|nr:Protein of unknown function DUF1712 [Carpediemonas membranifera]|eukprot:KAG9390119.1 Protein of unknown function DUF1712 [Carpediemonas membranifera]